jgi:nitrogenase molybdenum-iron protein alpha/beta subunit
MQPTNDELASANLAPLRVVDTIQHLLGFIKTKAESEDDGNTVALVNKISRDVASIREEHKNFDAQQVANYIASKEKPVSKQDPAFVAQSYEKTGAQDVNLAPFPKTGEESSAPFEGKGKTTKVEDLDAKQTIPKKPAKTD